MRRLGATLDGWKRETHDGARRLGENNADRSIIFVKIRPNGIAHIVDRHGIDAFQVVVREAPASNGFELAKVICQREGSIV
jgi:hypothetical protein